MSTYTYQPEFNYDAVDAADSIEITKHLLPFKGGFLKGLEAHLVNADNIQKFLASAPPETRKEINKNIDEVAIRLLSEFLRAQDREAEKIYQLIIDKVLCVLEE